MATEPAPDRVLVCGDAERLIGALAPPVPDPAALAACRLGARVLDPSSWPPTPARRRPRRVICHRETHHGLTAGRDPIPGFVLWRRLVGRPSTYSRPGSSLSEAAVAAGFSGTSPSEPRIRRNTLRHPAATLQMRADTGAGELAA